MTARDPGGRDDATNCPTCGRTKADCDDSAARGWDGCCMTCDEIGRGPNHRVLTVPNFGGSNE